MTGITWHRVDPGTIEQAIKLLLLDLYPGVRPIDGRGGDGGRDIRWDSPDGLVIFEIKSFSGERLRPAQRREIQRSLIRAHQQSPTRWILVVPLDHSPAEERWFDSLAQQFPAMRLEWWGLSWLDLQFGKREYLRRLVEGEAYELLALAREFKQEHLVLTSPHQATTRMQQLTDRAQALSARWRLDFYTSPSGVGMVYSPRFHGAEIAGEPSPTGDDAGSQVDMSRSAKLIMGKKYRHYPRVLDASALVALFSGHHLMLLLLEEAENGSVLLLVPALAIAEAQRVVAAPPSAWNIFFTFPGVLVRDLTPHIAVKVSSMASPRSLPRGVNDVTTGVLMAGQVVHEATSMDAVIVTARPETYEGHDVAVSTI
jgi:hypothetical protein